MTITWTGAHSNNYQKGRLGYTVKKVVIHWIVGSLESADATFQKPDRIASAHYGIGDRDIHQYVKEEDTAYHCGNLTTNRQSIGIEHEGGPDLPISDATYKSSAQLVADICRRYSIPVDRTHIIKHSEVKATQCPGTFDMDKLISMVIAILAPATGEDTIAVSKEKFADFERVKEGWNKVREKLNTEDNVTVVLAEIEKLVTYEDAVILKDKQLSESQSEIASLKAEVTRLQEFNTKQALEASVLTDKASDLEEKYKVSTQNYGVAMGKIKELEEKINKPQSFGWQKIVDGFFELFRR